MCNEIKNIRQMHPPTLLRSFPLRPSGASADKSADAAGVFVDFEHFFFRDWLSPECKPDPLAEISRFTGATVP
jgi:hypothetical protein